MVLWQRDQRRSRGTIEGDLTTGSSKGPFFQMKTCEWDFFPIVPYYRWSPLLPPFWLRIQRILGSDYRARRAWTTHCPCTWAEDAVWKSSPQLLLSQVRELQLQPLMPPSFPEHKARTIGFIWWGLTVYDEQAGDPNFHVAQITTLFLWGELSFSEYF